MEWQPIETAPKGSYKEVAVGGGSILVHHEVDIIVPTSCGGVTYSYWIADEGRWSMFTKKHPPRRWMPLPEPLME